MRLCIDPEIDTIYIGMEQLRGKHRLYWALEQHRGVLIKVHDVFLKQSRLSPESEQLDFGECGRHLLRAFSGLKSLHLVRFSHPHWNAIQSRATWSQGSQERARVATVALGEFYSKECMASNGTMPIVLVRDS